MGVKCPNKGAKWRLLREHATLLVSNDSPNPLRSSLCLVISYRCICVFFCIAGTAYRSDLLCGKDVKDGGPCPPYENSFGPGLRTYVESGDCTNGLGESLQRGHGPSVTGAKPDGRPRGRASSVSPEALSRRCLRVRPPAGRSPVSRARRRCPPTGIGISVNSPLSSNWRTTSPESPNTRGPSRTRRCKSCRI